MTRLLRRCRCGDYDTLDLAGDWPAEWFKRPAGTRLYLVAVVDAAACGLAAAFALDAANDGRTWVAVAWATFAVVVAAVFFRRTWRQVKGKSKPPVPASPVPSAEQGSEHTGGSRG